MERSPPEPAEQRIELAHVSRARSDAQLADLLGTELPRLQRIARLLVGDGDTADELVAEAISRTLPKWRAGTVADPPAYLRRVLVNLVNRRWRRRRLALRSDHASLDWLPVATDATTAVDDRDRTLRALGALPARRRAVVVLRFYDDLDEAAIAALTNVATLVSQAEAQMEPVRVNYLIWYVPEIKRYVRMQRVVSTVANSESEKDVFELLAHRLP